MKRITQYWIVVIIMAALMTSCSNDDNIVDPIDPVVVGYERALDIFKEINAVPRPSNHEEKMRVYLRQFAGKHNLELSELNGNIIIYKPASKGMEDVPMVNLQTHIDMVCVAADGYDIDFMNQGIEQYNDGTYIWSKDQQTSLGADDGMGNAVVLSILENDDLLHGPLECLFTYAEESDFEGVNGITAGWIKSKYMINIDGENDNETIVGTAGGVRSTIEIAYNTMDVPEGYKAMDLELSGMAGGHSGLMIDNKGCNAIREMSLFLYDLKVPGMLVALNGGLADNVIAEWATCTVVTKEENAEALKEAFNSYMKESKARFAETDPYFDYSIQDIETPALCMVEEDAITLIEGLSQSPYGVLEEGTLVPGLFELSSNIGLVDMESGVCTIKHMTRGFETAKMDAAEDEIEQAYHIGTSNAKVTVLNKFNAWNCDLNAPLLKHVKDTYKKVFGKDITPSRVGGGLESSVLAEVYPDIQIVNLGINTYNVHSIDEHVEIASVKKIWECLVDVLSSLKE